MKVFRILAAVLSCACSSPAEESRVKAPERPTTAAPATAAEPTPPLDTESAITRADALIEEMRKREADQVKFDRDNPTPPPPTAAQLADVERLQAPRAAPTTNAQTALPPTVTTAPVPTAPADAAPADPRMTETWWKEQARTLQVRLEEDTRLMNQAGSAMANSTLKITADEAEREYRARVAAVQNSRAAIDRLHDDARRAGVPPGWARWP